MSSESVISLNAELQLVPTARYLKSHVTRFVILLLNFDSCDK